MRRHDVDVNQLAVHIPVSAVSHRHIIAEAMSRHDYSAPLFSQSSPLSHVNIARLHIKHLHLFK